MPARISTITFLSSSGSRGSSSLLQLGLERRELLAQLGQLGLGQLGQLRVAATAIAASSSCDRRLGAPVLGEHPHRLFERGALLREIAQLARIARDLGIVPSRSVEPRS